MHLLLTRPACHLLYPDGDPVVALESMVRLEKSRKDHDETREEVKVIYTAKCPPFRCRYKIPLRSWPYVRLSRHYGIYLQDSFEEIRSDVRGNTHGKP